MPHLHLIERERITETYPLDAGEALLGREDYCDIQLRFAGISRKHLRLLTVMGDTFLEDLGSKNGTYVNGRLARKCVLNDGDVLQLGEIELRFEKDPANDPLHAPQDPDATTVLTPGQFGPASRAAREADIPVEGISPVAHRIAKTRELRGQSNPRPASRPGLWARIRDWLGG
jgi:pSer/pThr/pTyr-binding forkhead associated (FHA) protein